MNIYVDPLYDTPRGQEWNHDQAAHLFCLPGDKDALQDFGELMELNSVRWKPDDVVPHWELSPDEHAIAIEAGAKPVSRAGMEQAVRIWRHHRAQMNLDGRRKRGQKK